MIRYVDVTDATMLALERHEAHAHAIPGREVRDLGDAIALVDLADPEPFWNRLQAVRWPDDDAGFDRRLTAALAFFAAAGRLPHVWPSPAHATPSDLAARLVDHGFHDVGGGHLMVLDDPDRCLPVGDSELAPGVTVHAIATAADARPEDPDDLALVLTESFGALAPSLAADLRETLDDPRIVLVLVRVDGEPASAAKATTFDGLTYVSSVGTRQAFRGRSLAGLATRHALTAGGRSPGVAYLGVFSGNEPALRLYERLGFASLGESPDLLLELIRWARLTWQAEDPASLARDLARRLGIRSRPGGLAPRARLLDLGNALLEVRPWVSEGPDDPPRRGGRLMLEPVPGGDSDPDPAPGAPLRLLGLGWSTVELDRAASELEPWLGPPAAGNPRPDPHLGATAIVRAGAGLPGDWTVLLEPATEGGAAASLARDGEGPCALYLRPATGLEAWLDGAREPRDGPFGRQVLLPGPFTGPFVIVTEGLEPSV